MNGTSDHKIRMLRAMLRMVEGCMNRATNKNEHEKWKEQHQKLVAKITELKK